MPFNLGTLINYQALLVGNLIGVPLCYFIIRVVRNPFYLRSYYSQLKQQVDAKDTKKEFAIWLLALGALHVLLCSDTSKMYNQRHEFFFVHMIVHNRRDNNYDKPFGRRGSEKKNLCNHFSPGRR